MYSFDFSLYKTMSSMHNARCTSFLIRMPILSSCRNGLAGVTNCDESGLPCLGPDLRGKAFGSDLKVRRLKVFPLLQFPGKV